MKRLLLSSILYFSFFNTILLAQTATAPTGSGTLASPYQIATLNNLYWITQNSGSWNKYFVQTADIDATSSSTWAAGAGFSPIGNTTTNFTGSYDGRNFTISNIYINRINTSSVGVFGRLSTPCSINNLNIKDVSISTTNGNYIGSLVGYFDSGTITGCTASGTVTATTSNGSSFGGFVGIVWTSGSLENCSSSVNVIVNSSSQNNANIGGFVGYLNTNCTISKCFSTGNIQGDGSAEGGFAGTLNGTVDNCYSSGSVTRANSKTGTTIAAFVGSLGSTSIPAISNCYASGSVYYTGITNPTNKGFVGSSSVASGKVTRSYFNGTLSNQSSDIANGAVKKTSAELQTLSTFSGWDFATTPIWVLNSGYNGGFPFFAWMANTWTGSTSTDWNTAANWNLGITPSSSSNVIIPQVSNLPLINAATNASVASVTVMNAASLTLNGGTLTTSNGITVSPGGALIGGSDNITSTVNLQQNIIAQRGYRIFANPFSTGQTNLSSAGLITTTTKANDVKTWSNQNNSWSSVGAGYSSLNIGANTPYACFVRGSSADGVVGLTYTSGPSAFTYSVSGTLNVSSYNVPAASNATNFSLIGNPYAAPVNTSALTGASGIPYYVYTISVSGNGRTKSGSWASVLTSSNTSTIPVLGVIALQTAGNYTVTTSDINTSGTIQTGLFGAEKAIQNLELIVEQDGNYQDKLFVRLDANATIQGTDRIDLQKFINDEVNLYTITSDNTKLAIDARNKFNIVPLGINAPLGIYNFKVSNNSLPSETAVYLKDNLLNTETLLETGTTYGFNISSDVFSQGEKRFTLLFSNKNVSQLTTDNAPVKFSAKVMGNVIRGNNLIVNVAGATGQVSINVRDINGRLIGSSICANGTNTITLNNYSKGICIVQVNNGAERFVEKVVKF